MRKIPENVCKAQREGFETVAEAHVHGIPEVDRKVRGKILMEKEGYEIVVPYSACYHFGKPRGGRKGDRF